MINMVACTLLLNPETPRAAVQMRTLPGLLLALVAALLNGTTSIFSRDEVKGPDVDIFVFHFWACMGVALTGLLFLLVTPVVWTPLGVASGVLNVLSSACAFWAASLVGVSVAPAIWSGVTALVSSLFGVLLDPIGRRVSDLPAALAGLALLMAGIAGIAYACERSYQAERERQESRLLEDTGGSVSETRREHKSGLLIAALAGFFGGLVLVPMEYAPREARGLCFLPLMAVGAIVAAPVVDMMALFARGKPLGLNLREAAPPGIAAGICWNIANAASILAIQYLGYTLAYPIMQSRMFVSGLWGILVFHEMKDPNARRIYWLSGPFLLLGATLLAFAS
ncbi:hypothetical protein KFL_000060620 [Klebsormidium nitens]|uniref:Uncharacterized protein n=1 Tax=Klebsormidium nitens TaxID=105231 RepID=A0A0U9HHU5_KLENI|nr:hypothetical protein KFL_000060620 [Klebsormidium nitens]|eukprot:GAQ77996.1 hypothetical protein KFL_000060620 [Klebsormidium nitens]